MTPNNSIQTLKTISNHKMFHKNSCIEPQSTTPKSLQKFTFISPTKPKFSPSIYLLFTPSIKSKAPKLSTLVSHYIITYTAPKPSN